MIKGEWKQFDYSYYIQKVHYVNGEVHRLDGPAIINYIKSNSCDESYLNKELWYKNDIQHRNGDKPAVKTYNRFGNLIEVKYFVEGKRHKNNGASVVSFYNDGSVCCLRYYKNNILSDLEKPSIIEFYTNGKKKYEAYYFNNRAHRDNGAAIIEYYKDGTIREERYYKNGDLCRVDGPACIMYDTKQNIKCCLYYINHTKLVKDEYIDLVDRIKSGKIKKSINRFSFKRFKIIYELIKHYGNQELIDLCENRLMIEKMKN